MRHRSVGVEGFLCAPGVVFTSVAPPPLLCAAMKPNRDGRSHAKGAMDANNSAGLRGIPHQTTDYGLSSQLDPLQSSRASNGSISPNIWVYFHLLVPRGPKTWRSDRFDPLGMRRPCRARAVTVMCVPRMRNCEVASNVNILSILLLKFWPHFVGGEC